ncbi:4-hydroxythreonine-4-phosphate dehydrogenase PdxA [Propionibacterium freudenreichii]|uniref:4-hydroxythreonine-4-phosphate dehydrogenase PdxA n=1 Tax=Propionibacterium freudenreichii TaxID=1744 RepID=A0A2C7ZKB4_9ACTN|nr:4-hydroxythreonine-4-phosphate dehydrogenase PdxA [Propionibacterium freudenreichii]MCT2992282.1 4-hydroxythreonine-4-phosphate dehydrogenase PdxA [Propionibacterium freudenreichii]MCT2993901.1 4-hydroxythreonine-4-phosphate dehydrogenase PdxA [Propionibacterium freudenreichii]MCT3011453.1 4-hydroxythreonine-4-phosphate dehydrogenase PdxA [Propionibacterium freudenreichii]MDK9348799.1 4-hydroxythreonine-4-phosphate dehydrogenase PdxA [Propionibacterium freudenreichii]MDK9627741.1 4-hydroxyt
MSEQPILGITAGDPAGIGPEITVKALANLADQNLFRAIVYADPSIIERAIQVSGLDMSVHTITDPAQADFAPGSVNVVDIGIVPDADAIEWGAVQEVAGRAAIASIEAATADALAQKIDGIVTAPINKEAIWATGSQFLGHTEMLAALCHAPSTDTMFVVKGLKIFFATRHMSLADAVAAIQPELIGTAIDKSVRALHVFGSQRARLAVAALNPHGGEGGHFGRQEIDVLRPAVESAASRGWDVVGPVPADAVFHQGVQGAYDAVLSLYHDQGHIASKTLDFDGTISATVGLPILRTSVDHGTAFDIAGTGKASPATMESALRVAVDFSRFVPAIRKEYKTDLSR